MAKKKPQVDFVAVLKQSHERWAYIFEHGTADPFWEDGCNLNLVRNHIINGRCRIEEECAPEDYPAIYFKEVPPEVEPSYMARADEIRKAAKASLEQYKSDSNLRYILRHRDNFTAKTQKKLCINAVIGYATGLEHYIQTDSLVDMRRHESPETYLQAFEICAQKMKETPVEEVQISLFSPSVSGSERPVYDDYDEDMEEEIGGMTMQ